MVRMLLFATPVLFGVGFLFAITQIPSDAHGGGFIGLPLAAIGLGNIFWRRRHAQALLRIQPGMEKLHWRGKRGIELFYGELGLALFICGIVIAVKFW